MSAVAVALYRSCLHRVGRGRLRELLDQVPFRIPTHALGLVGEEAFVATGQPLPVLRHDGRPVSLAPPPVASRDDLVRLIRAAFRTQVAEGEGQERIETAFDGLRQLASLETQLEGLRQTREKRDGDRSAVEHSIGQVFRHKQFGYRGVVVGWDAQCDRPAEWLAANKIAQSRGEQPFYHVIPDQPDCVRLFGEPRESKYVAQDNMEPIVDPEERAIQHEHLMAYFTRYSPVLGSFMPCEELAFIYPDEYPVVEEEETNAQLVTAAQRGDLKGVREKLEAGATVDALDQWGNGALHWAAHHGHHECIKTLLEHSANANIAHGNFGHSPLHTARDTQVMDLLLGSGANAFAVDREGYTCKEWATAAGRTEVAVRLGTLQKSAKGQQAGAAASLAEFVRTLRPVEVYDPEERPRFFGRFGSQLIHIMVFSSSAWTEESDPVRHDDVVEAMSAAFETYREATFINVLVDLDAPENADIVRQFGMTAATEPRVRALVFDRSDEGPTRCDQSIPDFQFDYSKPESYSRFAKQLEDVALAPVVTVRPDYEVVSPAGFDGAGLRHSHSFTEDVSSVKVRLSEVPTLTSLEVGVSVVATHPSYGP